MTLSPFEAFCGFVLFWGLGYMAGRSRRRPEGLKDE